MNPNIEQEINAFTIRFRFIKKKKKRNITCFELKLKLWRQTHQELDSIMFDAMRGNHFDLSALPQYQWKKSNLQFVIVGKNGGWFDMFLMMMGHLSAGR